MHCLQPCLDRLPDVVRHFPHPPVAVHAQDTKLSDPRTRSIRDRLKRILPDYTPFFASQQRKRKGHRYNTMQMSLLRNDVAYTAQSLSLKALLDLDDAGTLTPAELWYCAGRLIILRTKPPGAPGQVWHVNMYQHTASASKAARRAILAALSSIHAAARAQGTLEIWKSASLHPAC
eukprot:43154-Rhodomonas_salina.1